MARVVARYPVEAVAALVEEVAGPAGGREKKQEEKDDHESATVPLLRRR